MSEWKSKNEIIVFTPAGRIVIHVHWELSVKPINDSQCEFANKIISHATEDLIRSPEPQAIPFEVFKTQRQPFSIDHNRQETPFFAASIERTSLNA